MGRRPKSHLHVGDGGGERADHLRTGRAHKVSGKDAQGVSGKDAQGVSAPITCVAFAFAAASVAASPPRASSPSAGQLV